MHMTSRRSVPEMRSNKNLILQVSLFLHRVPSELGPVSPVKPHWKLARTPTDTPSESSDPDSSESEEEEEEDGWESGESVACC